MCIRVHAWLQPAPRRRPLLTRPPPPPRAPAGTIPQEWVYLPRLEQVYVKPGNPRLCGPLPRGMNFKLCDAAGSTECNVTAALDGPTCPPWNPVSDPLGPNTSRWAGLAGWRAGGRPGRAPARCRRRMAGWTRLASSAEASGAPLRP